MKKTITIIALIATGIASLAANRKHKQEPTPEVIVQTTGTKLHTYSTTLSFEVCPKDIVEKFKKEVEYPEDTIENTNPPKIYIHCRKCAIGVYLLSEGDTVEKCTYCGAEKPTIEK